MGAWAHHKFINPARRLQQLTLHNNNNMCRLCKEQSEAALQKMDLNMGLPRHRLMAKPGT